MHVIAYVYHWEPATLWLLSKSERKMWVDLITQQKKEEAKSFKNKDDGEYDEDDFEGETDDYEDE